MKPSLRWVALASVLGALTLAARARAETPARAINAVLGDRSYVARFGAAPTEGTDPALRVRTHLRYVERLLRARDVGTLSPALRAARVANLDRLRDYIARGSFPRNAAYPGTRPHFIDADGRICAVGYLVEQTAGRAAAEAINHDFEYAFVRDIHAASLDAWAARSGLTRRELAMIQPAYPWERDLPPPPPDPQATPEIVTQRLESSAQGVAICELTVLLPHQIPPQLTAVVRVGPQGPPQIRVTPEAPTDAFRECVESAVRSVFYHLAPAAGGQVLTASKTYRFRPRSPLTNPPPSRFEMELDAHHARESAIPCLPPLPPGVAGISQDVTVHFRALPQGGVDAVRVAATMPLTEAQSECIRAVVSRVPTTPFLGQPVEVTRVFPYLRYP